MSEETSSPVQKRAVKANSSSADTSTINSQREADEMVLEVGHDSPKQSHDWGQSEDAHEHHVVAAYNRL